ncbi:hypothetical protein TWF506_001136 [Arthrobotrys conoides]|uniref:Uncharacterized protein n=1 Tax=Arthrobotrys conoides TaxID=74498 RepID=A0AAN8NSN1_9PEZI
MVHVQLGTKLGKGANPTSDGKDLNYDFEDEKSITIKILEIEGGPTTSRWERAKAIFRGKLEAEEGGKLKKTSLEFLNEDVTPHGPASYRTM